MPDNKSDTVKLNLLKAALCRTPAFSPSDQLKNKWNELKELISLSSPSFYDLIANYTSADLDALSAKMRYTIWKYFNRVRFRPTPFGKLAAISIVPFSPLPYKPLILEYNLSLHRFNNWKQTNNNDHDHIKRIKSAHWFIVNSSIYRVGEEIRYIRRNDTFFELAAVTGFDELNAVLNACQEKIPRLALFTIAATELNMKDRQISVLLSQMLTLQLLFSDEDSNITGEDYFQRTGLKPDSSSINYIISERKLISGKIFKQDMHEIPQLISFLKKYLPDTENRDLADFRAAFFKKFEHRMMPLAEVLDLDLGIGYGNFGKQQSAYELTELLAISGANEKKKQQHVPYTALHRFLINRLMRDGPVRLEEFTDSQEISNLALPNTLSVLFHFYGKQPVIENIGGCTANALLGRFTIASPELENFAREIADLETQANPGVLFFDVAYQLEKQVDNVNRRKQLYPFELPLMNWSCADEPLLLDDIYVTVRGAEIMLWSKKYNKRMVPRIPSAYNYSRSDLALFRFLCDLQHQHIKSDLNFKLAYIFPELDHYPRVCFKKVIVSPATWKISPDLLQAINEDIGAARTRLINWLLQKKINFPFTAGHSDQKLCFDPVDEMDIEAFVYYCRQYGNQAIYISEALISDYDVFTNGYSKKHVAQFVASYAHERPVYKVPQLEFPANNSGMSHIIPPGKDWLYFEVYCHPARANEILINKVRVLLKGIKPQVDKWFFIRYDDPRPHIRLRLHLKNSLNGYNIIDKLQALFEQEIKTGLIQDIQIKTYFREIWRYGEKSMELAENLFFQDSRYVLRLLAGSNNINDLYVSTLLLMNQVVTLVLPDNKEQLSFAKAIADSFSQELTIQPANFKLLNQKFESLKRDHFTESTIQNFKIPRQLHSAYTNLFRKGNDISDPHRLLADVLHMHINRRFTSDQRAYEGIIYQYLVKFLIMQRLRSAVTAEC